MTRDERILSLATKGGCGQSVSLSFQRILLKLAMAMDSPARVSRRIARSWYPPSVSLLEGLALSDRARL